RLAFGIKYSPRAREELFRSLADISPQLLNLQAEMTSVLRPFAYIKQDSAHPLYSEEFRPGSRILYSFPPNRLRSAGTHAFPCAPQFHIFLSTQARWSERFARQRHCW